MSETAQVDGWAAEINASCPPAMAAWIREQPAKIAMQKAAWIASLRERGVRAAHPDDGWVDREAGTVHLCYAQFDDGLAVGDLLALGSPGGATRLVRVVEAIAPEPLVAPLWPVGKPYRWRFVDA